MAMKLSFCIWALFFLGAEAAAVTSSSETNAFRALGTKWDIKSQAEWNMTGDPCYGAVANSFAEPSNPGIICDCSFDRGNTCHIIKLKVYALDKSGELPAELGNLTYLINLDLGQNYFSGRLPAFMGNMTGMQYLSLGINNFSGPVPKELGSLQNLISLSFSSNNFNGTLPEELGSLTKLEQLYIDSSGVSGEIPSSFRNLKNMKLLWASDLQVTGPIPDFIGGWTNLIELRFQGTGLQGPIPSSFVNLTSLTSLRVGDLTSGFSSLSFLKNLKAMTALVLRNSRITGEIPSFIGDMKNLQHLDLSFNNLTGGIPNSFQNLSKLTFLFLGNNSLSGHLPSNISSSLYAIDFSYNEFSGSLPTWLTNEGLQVNIVGNYFQISEPDNRNTWKSVGCLQRTFPCNRGAPQYSKFAVNCGGDQKTSATGTVYQRDNETLGPASFYVTDAQDWGVSSVGRFMDRTDNPTYVKTISSQFPNSLDSELYQTARVSPSSLRYYGLGLQNGPYKISLQFAEIEMPSTASWQGLGRRYFDVYIQGKKVLTDFNIEKEAGSSYTTVVHTFEADVTNNVMEIHFFWAGKGTCCIPVQGAYGILVSAISASSEFNPTTKSSTNSGKSGSGSKTGMVIGIIFGCLAILLIFACFIIWLKRTKYSSTESGLKDFQYKVEQFTFSQLQTATRNFNEENKLGEGAYGVVYKGILPGNKQIAVKQLSSTSKQGAQQFMNEVAAISSVQHRNLVRLYGCCIEGDHRILVYEYLENNSLEQALFVSRIRLDWPTRYSICIQIASGLAYLHEESHVKIIHRDVKASNILLDESLNPKISDFGLAKLSDPKETHMSTRVAGTYGYLAPEYAMRGHLTEKADVFSFGVVVLEIVSGRRNEDPSLPEEKSYLLQWAWDLYEQGRLLELLDETVLDTARADQVERVIAVSLLCTQAVSVKRPSMSRVVNMLAHDSPTVIVDVPRPSYIADFMNAWKGSQVVDSAKSSSITASPFVQSAKSSSITASPFVQSDIAASIIEEGR